MNYEPMNHRQAQEILNSKLNSFREIEQVVRSLTFTPFQKGDHSIIQDEFKRRGWQTEEPIAEGLSKKWRYDALKDRIAVEIDTKSTSYRSFLKFIKGYNQGKIEVGVIIVYNDKKMPNPKHHRFTATEKELKDLFTIVPVPILLMGIYP